MADQVIVVEHGTISQIGDFRNLRCRHGYVRGCIVGSVSTEHRKESPPQVNSGESSAKPKRAPPTPKQNTPQARQIGSRGRSIYKFYLRPIGLLRLLVLLIAVVALALATRFQRKSKHMTPLLIDSSRLTFDQGIWVQWWTEADDRQNVYIVVYFVLTVGACLSFAFFFW